MILLDTNVFIYLANGTINIDTIKQDVIGFASITKIESLGYSQIKDFSHIEGLHIHNPLAKS